MQKLINIHEYICSSLEYMSTIRKKQICTPTKCPTLKKAKFYSSKIKWIYSNHLKLTTFIDQEKVICPSLADLLLTWTK